MTSARLDTQGAGYQRTLDPEYPNIAARYSVRRSWAVIVCAGLSAAAIVGGVVVTAWKWL
jgi:hypothetical protein